MTTTRQTRLLMTSRDHALLLSLLKYRYLSVSQMRRLHFPSEQTTSRRLRLLQAHGLVSLFRPRGSAHGMVALARAGAEAVAEQLGCALEELGWDGRRESPKDLLFLEHFLAASDFRITLSEACAKSADTRVLGFLPEHLVEPTPKGAMRKYIRDVITDAAQPRQKISHSPDGVFALERKDRAALFFLEIDRGTEVLTNPERGVLKLVRFYLAMLEAGTYQRYQSDFGVAVPFNAFRALLITTNSERMSNIRSACDRMIKGADKAKRFIWLTSIEAVSDEALLDRRWYSLDPTDAVEYRLGARSEPQGRT